MVKPDHQVVRWFPKELFERFQALDSICYNMREEMRQKGAKLRTRVRVGYDDLEFSTKLPGGRWVMKPIPNGLPAIDLEARSRPSLTSSPPPGRPVIIEDENDRKRQFSGRDVDTYVKKSKLVEKNQKGLQGDRIMNLQKRQAGDKNVDTEVLEKGDHEEVLGSNQPDPGLFIGREGYSPATPAKVKNISTLSSVINSPIFQNRGRQIQK